MEKIHIIFKPEMMFQDYIKSCWSSNIKTINGKIPINKILLAKGIFALDILPEISEEIYCFALPINKNWSSEDFNADSSLCFDLYCEEPLSIDIAFQNSQTKNSQPNKIMIDKSSTDQWISINMPLTIKKDVRLILFSGSASETSNFVIKDIVIQNI